MFLTDQDYAVVIGESALRVFSQVSTDNRHAAEAEAREEMASYLRPKYDVQAIFATEGEARNRLLVMYCVDIALYHLAASAPQKMGSDIRRERYERAIRWFEGVARGTIVPDLPLATAMTEDGSAPLSGFIYGTQPPLNHNW